MIYIFLAEGFEESEALVPADILKRAGYEVKTVGIGSEIIKGSHKISVVCDITIDKIPEENIEAIILPGGLPGTLNLEKDKTVQHFIDYCYKNGILIGAICAAPSILGHKNILKGKKAVCYYGYEKDLTGATVLDTNTARDGNIITACGAGASFDFGYEILNALTGNSLLSDKLKQKMRYTK